MKKIILSVILALFMIATASAFYTASPIGIDNAKENAALFLGKDISDLSYQNEDRQDIGSYYIFNSDNARVYVNMYTGKVERASYNDARRSSGKVLIDSSKAETIAKDYAKKNYDDFDGKNMKLIESKLLNHGDSGSEYSFVWRENIDDVLTPNFVLINLNAESGKIISYIGINRELTVSTKPKITEEEAFKIATEQYPDIEIVKSDSYLSIEYTKPETQSLIWVITLEGKPVDYTMYGGTVVIDAKDGSVLMKGSYC